MLVKSVSAFLSNSTQTESMPAQSANRNQEANWSQRLAFRVNKSIVIGGKKGATTPETWFERLTIPGERTVNRHAQHSPEIIQFRIARAGLFGWSA